MRADVPSLETFSIADRVSQRWNDLPKQVLDLGRISFRLAIASDDGDENFDGGDDEVAEEQMETISDLANGQRRSRSKGSP